MVTSILIFSISIAEWIVSTHTISWSFFLSFEGLWGYWAIAFFQQVASLGNNIAIQIAAGSSLKVSHHITYTIKVNSLYACIASCTFVFSELVKSLQAVYKYFKKDGTLTLQHFIIFFGAFELFLSQLPNIHSLRWVNAICTACTVGFAATTIGVTIYNGYPRGKSIIHTSHLTKCSFGRTWISLC